MNSEKKLQQLQEEIKQEMAESIKNSNFGKLFEKYGMSGDDIVKFQCIIDLTKIESTDAVTNHEIKDALRAIPAKELVIADCCWYTSCFCCRPC
jgi:hypothetical protein